MNSTIHIPGSLTAKIENGRITGYVFMIAANDAGYFGPAFRLFDGDEVTDEQMSDLIADTLTISQDRQSAFMTVELGA
jgi:hypothetical protein